jgi:hypothetical protein
MEKLKVAQTAIKIELHWRPARGMQTMIRAKTGITTTLSSCKHSF